MQSRHLGRSRIAVALASGCSAALLGLASACGGSDTTTKTASGQTSDAATTGGTSNGGGTSSGGVSNGGLPNGGAAGVSGKPGNGGTTDCPPECFVNNRCVNSCGETPRDFGCCPCPPDMINVFSCGARDGGTSGGATCDPRKALCRSLPPTCPMGQVASIDGSCWGPCVPIASCSCSSAAECPDPGQYTCHLSRGVCDYYVN